MSPGLVGRSGLVLHLLHHSAAETFCLLTESGAICCMLAKSQLWIVAESQLVHSELC